MFKTFTKKKTEKKNPKNNKLATRINSLHNAGLYSLGRNFLFRRKVAIAETAIVKLAILALIARMINGALVFIYVTPQATNITSNG